MRKNVLAFTRNVNMNYLYLVMKFGFDLIDWFSNFMSLNNHHHHRRCRRRFEPVDWETEGNNMTQLFVHSLWNGSCKRPFFIFFKSAP